MALQATPSSHGTLKGPMSPLPICKKSPKVSPAVCRSEPKKAQRLIRAVQTAATTLEAPDLRSDSAQFETTSDDTAPQEGNDSFATKLKKVWDIFFPEQPSKKSKDIAARRLRMILVADRCGLSDEGFAKIKASVVEAVQEYVEVCDDKLVNVNIKNHPELGTVYSVDVPVQRIRPKLRVDPDDADDEDADRQVAAGTFQWQENDMDSDPSARFPYGC